jgi:hypothetical protein
VGCGCWAWGVAEQGDLCSEGRLQRLSLDNSRSILRDREAAFQFGSLVCFQIHVEGGEDFAGSGLFFIQVAMSLTQFPNCVTRPLAPWSPYCHLLRARASQYPAFGCQQRRLVGYGTLYRAEYSKTHFRYED